jgi:kynureninase
MMEFRGTSNIRFTDVDGRLSGWWGNQPESRFQMKPEMDCIPGAQGFRMSNPCVLAVVSLLGSLQVFEKTSMEELNAKTRLLTGYLEMLLDDLVASMPQRPFEIITPRSPSDRGCQLSILFNQPIKPIFAKLLAAGVVCDKREPNVLRLAPVPMYNSFADVWRFVSLLKDAIISA